MYNAALRPDHQPYQLESSLVLSTAHIPFWIAHLLDTTPVDREPSHPLYPVSFDRVHCGYRIWADTEDYRHDIPFELRRLMDLALSLHAKWLILDCDGPIRKDLPMWEW